MSGERCSTRTRTQFGENLNQGEVEDPIEIFWDDLFPAGPRVEGSPENEVSKFCEVFTDVNLLRAFLERLFDRLAPQRAELESLASLRKEILELCEDCGDQLELISFNIDREKKQGGGQEDPSKIRRKMEKLHSKAVTLKGKLEEAFKLINELSEEVDGLFGLASRSGEKSGESGENIESAIRSVLLRKIDELSFSESSSSDSGTLKVEVTAGDLLSELFSGRVQEERDAQGGDQDDQGGVRRYSEKSVLFTLDFSSGFTSEQRCEAIEKIKSFLNFGESSDGGVSGGETFSLSDSVQLRNCDSFLRRISFLFFDVGLFHALSFDRRKIEKLKSSRIWEEICFGSSSDSNPTDSSSDDVISSLEIAGHCFSLFSIGNSELSIHFGRDEEWRVRLIQIFNSSLGVFQDFRWRFSDALSFQLDLLRRIANYSILDSIRKEREETADKRGKAEEALNRAVEDFLNSVDDGFTGKLRHFLGTDVVFAPDSASDLETVSNSDRASNFSLGDVSGQRWKVFFDMYADFERSFLGKLKKLFDSFREFGVDGLGGNSGILSGSSMDSAFSEFERRACLLESRAVALSTLQSNQIQVNPDSVDELFAQQHNLEGALFRLFLNRVCDEVVSRLVKNNSSSREGEEGAEAVESRSRGSEEMPINQKLIGIFVHSLLRRFEEEAAREFVAFRNSNVISLDDELSDEPEKNQYDVSIDTGEESSDEEQQSDDGVAAGEEGAAAGEEGPDDDAAADTDAEKSFFQSSSSESQESGQPSDVRGANSSTIGRAERTVTAKRSSENTPERSGERRGCVRRLAIPATLITATAGLLYLGGGPKTICSALSGKKEIVYFSASVSPVESCNGQQGGMCLKDVVRNEAGKSKVKNGPDVVTVVGCDTYSESRLLGVFSLNDDVPENCRMTNVSYASLDEDSIDLTTNAIRVDFISKTESCGLPMPKEIYAKCSSDVVTERGHNFVYAVSSIPEQDDSSEE